MALDYTNRAHTVRTGQATGRSSRTNPFTSPTVRIWTAQAVLAALFVFAGGMKLVTPPDTMADQSSGLPVAFMYFIGVCELLGGIGVVLPRALHIREGLTPLAAAGLVVIMAGATVVTAIDMPAAAVIPFAVGLLCLYVAVNRTRELRANRA